MAFRSTSKLYKDDSDPELMRTYGYWLSLLIDSSITDQVSENDLKNDFSKIIRFVNGRGSMAPELLKRVQCFTGDILSMERAALSWKATSPIWRPQLASSGVRTERSSEPSQRALRPFLIGM